MKQRRKSIFGRNYNVNTLEVEGDILYAAKSIDQIIKEGNLDVTEEEILNKLPQESNIIEFAIKSAINGNNY